MIMTQLTSNVADVRLNGSLPAAVVGIFSPTPIMKPKYLLNRWLLATRVLLGLISLMVVTLPAAAAFKATIQGRDFGATNWNGGPLSGHRELDVIAMRVLFTGGPATNYAMTLTFDHTKGTSRGIEDLINFLPATNVIITAGPTLVSPAGVDIWSYTLTVTVTNTADAELRFSAPITSGAHNFGGASLSMGLSGGGGNVQVQKPPLVLGSPDLAITKIGPSEAKTNQIITYIINYTNKLIAADTALGVQVIDTLPPYVSYVPGSGSKGIKVLGNTLTWTLGNLTPGRRGILTYKVVVTNNVPVTTTFANYAQIFSSQNDATPADNIASVNTTVVVIPTPLVQDDYYFIGKNQTLTVPAPGVLINDSNALSATLLSAPVNGTLSFNTNGSFTYVPNAGFLGTEIFAYQGINSSNISGPAVVWVEVTNTCFVLNTFNTISNNAPGQCGVVVNFALPITTGDCADFTYSPTNGSFFPIGNTTVTFTNTDGVSNAFQVTVVDAESPTISCPSNMLFSAGAGQCSRSNVTYSVTFNDNCPGAGLLQVSGLPSGATYPVGITTNQFIATDANGNSASCIFTVTVLDNDPPTITCPANIVVAAAAGGCTSNVTFNATANDGCSGAISVVSVPASGSVFLTGVTTVTNTATDSSGNTSTCTFTVTVLDAQSPTITCPAPVTVAANNGACAATNVNLSAPITGDNCGVATVTNNAPVSFPVGTNVVTWTVVDNGGNVTTCQQIVVVSDSQPPVLTCPTDVTVAAGAGLCGATNVALGSASASDNCGSVTLTNNAPVQFSVGTNIVTWTALDASGNSVSCQQRVIVQDTQPPAINCPTNQVLAADPGQCSRSNVTFTVTASDNCSGVTVVSIPPSGSTFPLGTTTVTNIATDASGNQTTCTFTVNTFSVTINDTQPPVITCPLNLVFTASPGQCSRSNVTFLVTATDNCTVTNLVSTPASGSTFPVGMTTVTNVATDAGGNQAVCTFTVTVTDGQAPAINCPSNMSVIFPPGVTATNVSFTVTANDACGLSSLQSVPASGSVFTAGVTTVTNTAVDNNGNTSTCTFTITVTVANSAPVANTQNVSTPEDTVLPIALTGSDFDGNPLTYILVSGPTNGSLVGFNTNTGALTYTPNTNYVGADAFTFRVNDGQTNSAVAVVSITVTPVNDAPFANNQSVSTPEDTALPITLTGSDVEGTPLTFVLVSGPANGSISGFNTNTGALTYAPATNYNGADSLTFRVSDGTNLSAVATVSITVTPVNDAPFANNQSVNTPEDTALSITLTGSDAEGAALTYIVVTGPANGSISGFNTNTGALTYQPNTNYNGADSLTFRVSDGTNLSAVATVSITVTPANDAPFANSQSVSTPEDTALPITLTGSDVEGTPLTFVLVSGPANGSLSGFNTNTGALTYQPNTNYTGADSFTFRTSDGTNTSALATVSITVTAVNDAPIANNDFTGTPRNVPVTINVLANDSDVDGNPISLFSQSTTNGTLSVVGTNLFFTPASNYVGSVVLTYTITDGNSAFATAFVFVNVTIGTNTPPVANNDVVSVPEDSLLTFDPRGNDLDADGDPFFISGVVTTNGTASVAGGTNVSYLPPTNFVGTVTLTYTINDGNGGTASATITVTVTPVNDAPFANSQSVSTPEDTALPVTLTGSDVEGSPLTFVLVASPANGTITGFNTNAGALTYRPNTNYTGADSFTFRVNDGSSNSAVATVSITVTPVNDAPFANNQSVSTPEDTALPITLTGSDVEGSPLTFILVGGPANGSLSGFNTNTGALTYTPNTNYTGADSFTFRTSDGTNTSAVATVSITVTPVNDAPFANNQNVITAEDTAAPITLTGSDVEGSSLTFILVSGPTNGTLSGFNTNTGALTYTPGTNYNGADAFTFRVSDGTNLSAAATVSITVTPVADAPRAFNQGLITPEDTALPITLVGTSPDGNPLTYQLLAAPTHGAFTGLNTNTGVLTYQPATNYNGPDAFTFRVSDGFTNSLVATVSITVTPVNDAPIIVNDATNTPSGQPVVLPPLVNDIDPDGGALTISCAVTTNGTAVISGTNIIITSASNFVGTVTVTYCATNQTGGSGSATITVSVTPPSNPTFAISQGTNTLNPQTGLFEQRVTVTNTSIITASAFRLLVGNINSPQGVPRTNVWLYNATGTNVDNRPYVLYNAPLNPGQFVTLTLEFVVPDRRPFTNSLEVVQVLPVVTGTNLGSGVVIDRTFLDNRFSPARLVIEWTSIPGRTYTVIYSNDNMATWRAATPSVNAVNTRTQWYDDGPPKTATVPLSQGSRYYRVILAPLNN